MLAADISGGLKSFTTITTNTERQDHNGCDDDDKRQGDLALDQSHISRTLAEKGYYIQLEGKANHSSSSPLNRVLINNIVRLLIQ